jgi:hypothetical protein
MDYGKYEKRVRNYEAPPACESPMSVYETLVDWAADDAFEADREIADKDQRIADLEQALQDLLSVTPAEPPAKGLIKDIEEQHKNAVETAKKLLADRG